MPTAAYRQEVLQGLRKDVDPETDEALSAIAVAKELGIPATEVDGLPSYWRDAAHISLRSAQLIRQSQR